MGQLDPETRELQLQVSDLQNQIGGSGGVLSQLATNQQNIASLLVTRVSTPPAPVGNLLYNGELGFSINAWFDNAYVTSFTAKQCAFFWSDNAPAVLQTFTAVTVANEIPIPGHSYTTGCSIQFTNTGGALPTNLIAGTTYYAIYLTPNTISVALTVADAFTGTVLIIPTSGTGTQTIQQVLDETVQNLPSATNRSLRSFEPSTPPAAGYDPHYCRWDNEAGEAQITGTMSLDQRLPSNMVDATTPLARVSLIAARTSANIEIPATCLFGAGIWDNTLGRNCFLPGDIGFAAEFVGTPTPGGVTRQFRALLTSDRGYQTLSPVVTVSNTPADLDSTHYIGMSWGQQSGQLQVNLYEYVPSLASYRLLTQISSQTSFIYEGAFEAEVPGWPSTTGPNRDATFITSTGNMSAIAINGVSAAWTTINFPIAIPNNYNKALTTGHQWLRLWLSQPMNLRASGVVSDGSTTIIVPDSVFNSAAFDAGGYGTGSTNAACLYVGLVTQVFDENDVLLATTSIASVASNTSITLADVIPSGVRRKIRVIGGGFHGLLVDKINLGFQQNTSYIQNAVDTRYLQPVAAPTSSDQGTVGDGGSGGGPRCVAAATPIKAGWADDAWNQIQYMRPGGLWASPGLKKNILIDLKPGMDRCRLVRTANGARIRCTDTERFVVDSLDENGTMLAYLRVGDSVLTDEDGAVVSSKIVEIGPLGELEMVYTPVLSDNRIFIAGEHVEPMWYVTLWRWLRRGHVPKRVSYLLHNRKDDSQPGDGEFNGIADA